MHSKSADEPNTVQMLRAHRRRSRTRIAITPAAPSNTDLASWLTKRRSHATGTPAEHFHADRLKPIASEFDQLGRALGCTSSAIFAGKLAARAGFAQH